MNTHNGLVRARRWRRGALWAVVVVGGLAVLVPVLLYLFLVVSLGFAPHSPTVGEAQAAMQSYYGAVQRHDYTTAYTYVDPHTTVTVDGQPRVVDSVDTLASIAQSADQKDGVITAYTMIDGQFERGRKVVDMTVRVTRSAGSQDVHIQISLSNGKWRILRMDSA